MKQWEHEREGRGEKQADSPKKKNKEKCFFLSSKIKTKNPACRGDGKGKETKQSKGGVCIYGKAKS